MTETVSREVIFAALAVIVALARYGTYLWSIYRMETRPHAFSWFIWGLVTSIGAAAQFDLDAGLSAWVLTFVAVTCFLISVLAVFVGHRDITRSDWAALIGSFIAIAVWAVTSNPVGAIASLIAIDFLSYWPTIRKSWADPWGEPPISYFWAGLRYFFAMLAVPEFLFVTMLYPFWLMATDWGFLVYLVWRRSVSTRSGAPRTALSSSTVSETTVR
jgi:hypothetical protein